MPRKRSSKGEEWERKTEELGGRGITLKDLISFYKHLCESAMLTYQPSLHTTSDVVRRAIIPMTYTACSSYAELVSRGNKVIPKKMVIHNWSNLFRDLLASVVADAIGEHTFHMIAELLSDQAGVQVVEQLLVHKQCMQETYWICAFAVNQHRGICSTHSPGDVDPVTSLPHPVCCCNTLKFFNKTPPVCSDGGSISCEMNKFDDMMAYVSSKDPQFSAVIVADTSLDIFSRAWCMAEVAEAQQILGCC